MTRESHERSSQFILSSGLLSKLNPTSLLLLMWEARVTEGHIHLTDTSSICLDALQ